LFDGKTLNDDDKNPINWFVITALPMEYRENPAKNNWRPFAYELGAPPLYSM